MTTTEEITEDTSIETTQTWNKFVRSAKKAGFRDGADDGRNEIFQKSFDVGYLQGFKNGFAVGNYLGATRGESLKNSSPIVPDSHLQNTRRGLCQICADQKLLESTTNKIVHIQTQFSNDILKKLQSKYLSTTQVILPNKLE